MEMKELINHPNLIRKEKWIRSVSNEYGRLLKGVEKKHEGKNQVELGFDSSDSLLNLSMLTFATRTFISNSKN